PHIGQVYFSRDSPTSLHEAYERMIPRALHIRLAATAQLLHYAVWLPWFCQDAAQSKKMDFQRFLLGEITAEEAGRFTAQACMAVALLAGVWKCWSISRRTTTNSKCALSLMFILLAWLTAVITGTLASRIGSSSSLSIMTGLLGL